LAPETRKRWEAAVICLAVVLAGAGCGSSRSPATSAAESNRSPSTSSAGKCSPGDLKLTVSDQGATQALVATVSLENAGGSPCKLDSSLRLALSQPNGTVAGHVRGNPSTVRLHQEQVAPGATVTRSWIWRNWCGSSRRMLLTASAGALSGKESATPPVCADKASPSTLAPQFEN
jgi:hypothetical protein